jgi:hypothetical protein
MPTNALKTLAELVTLWRIIHLPMDWAGSILEVAHENIINPDIVFKRLNRA